MSCPVHGAECPLKALDDRILAIEAEAATRALDEAAFDRLRVRLGLALRDLLRAVVIGDAPGPGNRRRSLIVLDLDEFASWYGGEEGS